MTTLTIHIDLPHRPVQNIERAARRATEGFKSLFADEVYTEARRRIGNLGRRNFDQRMRRTNFGFTADLRPIPWHWIESDIFKALSRVRVRRHWRRRFVRGPFIVDGVRVNRHVVGGTIVRAHRRTQFQAFGRLQGRFSGSYIRFRGPYRRTRQGDGPLTVPVHDQWRGAIEDRNRRLIGTFGNQVATEISGVLP